MRALRTAAALLPAGAAPALVLGLALLACEGGRGGGADGGAMDVPLRLQATPESVVVRPFSSREIVVRLVDAREQGVPDRSVTFAILDDPSTPEDEARGATLSFDQALTDAGGHVRLQIIAGPATIFRVRASAARAPDLDVVVVVSSATHGSAEVVPLVVAEEGVAPVSTVRLYRYDGTTSCSKLRPTPFTPPPTVWPIRTLPLDEPALFVTVSTEDNHAILGLGLDASETVRYAGCVDIPGLSLLPQKPVKVLLPLLALRPAIEGEYEVLSRFVPQPRLRAAAVVGDAWRTLVECPNDPVRLFLDCTVDALGPASPEDPVDCRPGPDEGPLAARIEGRRGTHSLTRPRCREATDAMGRRSLEALVHGLFPSPPPPALADLVSITAEAATVLDGFTISSRLRVARTSWPDRYQLEHTLSGFESTIGAMAVPVPLRELGMPITTVPAVRGTLRRGDLEIARHAFTLRVGTAARAALGRGSLARRGAPSEPGRFAPYLLNLLARGPATGCAALDDAVCSELGEPRGCVQAACLEGVASLSRQLEAGFLGLDGTDLDLFLEGTAPLVDLDRDGRADALGWIGPGLTDPGLWSAEVRGAAGPVSLSAPFTARRAP